MRQIRDSRREERIRGRSDDAADASIPATPTAPPSAPKDFTAQVMARLATPAKPDPELARIQRARARAARFVRLYIGLALVIALALALLGLFAPWALAEALSRLVALAVDIFSGLAFAGRSTDGFINWQSVIYALMLVALIPVLALLRRGARRRSARHHPKLHHSRSSDR